MSGQNTIRWWFMVVVLWVFLLLVIQLYRLAWPEVSTIFHPGGQYIKVWKHHNVTSTNGDWRVILQWTPFFKHDWRYFYKTSSKCPFKCRLINDKSKVHTADALLFNARDLLLNESFPMERNPNQVWILHSTEPPYYTFLNMWKYDGLFNWTSFLRKDSDIPSYYDKTIPVNLGEKLQIEVPLKWRKPHDYHGEKTKFAFWMASSCSSFNGRERYMESLRKLAQVDLFGNCGHESCLRSSGKEHPNCTRTLKQYKFTLAFENGNCRDYITEKFWRPLKLGVIPVVLGGSVPLDYTKVAPPHSYIHMKDYSSEEQLIEELQRISDNKTLYNSFFDWRKNFMIANTYWCDLCTTLHGRFHRQAYDDLDGWFRQDSCQPWNLMSAAWKNVELAMFKAKLKLHMI